MVIAIICAGYYTRNYLIPIINKEILGPKINFKTQIIDIGTIQNKRASSYYFVFGNTGYRKLEIYNIITTCDCMSYDKPTHPISIGQFDSILIVLDSTITGYFSKEVIIVSNSVTSPDHIYIVGNILSDNIHGNY